MQKSNAPLQKSNAPLQKKQRPIAKKAMLRILRSASISEVAIDSRNRRRFSASTSIFEVDTDFRHRSRLSNSMPPFEMSGIEGGFFARPRLYTYPSRQWPQLRDEALPGLHGYPRQMSKVCESYTKKYRSENLKKTLPSKRRLLAEK